MQQYIEQQANETISSLQSLDIIAIRLAVEVIVNSIRNGGKLLLCGNGGSAADCQHIATEFVVRFQNYQERPNMPAIALTTDTSILTASSNDFSFNDIFAIQIKALAKKNDVLFGISTSGNSDNVIKAMITARQLGGRTIALLGNNTKNFDEICDVAIRVNNNVTARIQETHLFIEHIICDMVEKLVYPDLFKKYLAQIK